MEFLNAFIAVAIPFAAMFIPGFASVRGDGRLILLSGARMMLWSLGSLTLASFIAVSLGIPLVFIGIGAAIAGISIFWARRDLVLRFPVAWMLLGTILPIVMATALYAIPFLLNHTGLPTGDSQKAIIWAQEIIHENKLPNYGRAVVDYNRDPGDFFTPGLHTLTALVMSLSPYPLTSVGIFAIAAAVLVAWLAAAISRELYKDYAHIIPPLLTAFFVLTNTRFLRYLREPGYHYQNIFGEIFLFGLLLLGLRLIRKFSWRDFSLAAILLISLVITHQFSVFVAIFALAPIAIAFFFTRLSRRRFLAGSILIVLLLVAAIPFGFYEKLPHLFTTTPHLLGDVPDFTDYPAITGVGWFTLSFSGFILLVVHAVRKRSITLLAFCGSTLAILLLSQGPRLFIDIPPVRALFYAVVPLSISASFLVTHIRHFFAKQTNLLTRRLSYVALAILVGLPAVQTTARAFTTTNHVVRTNSTLLPEQEYLSQRLSDSDQGASIVIDDYNRRSSSWLILSGEPMFTRVAADIQRQMNEAKQSKTRMDLYLKQLDFEKMYSLGSLPEIMHLMQKHNIQYVTGIEKSSATAFGYNPALQEDGRGGDAVLFTTRPGITNSLTDETHWLLKATTLVNDIGDTEDTFAHLPASVRSSRISAPQFDGEHTFRSVSAPVIPLVFNSQSYVSALWDQEHTNQADIPLELLVHTIFGPQSFDLLLPDGTVATLVTGQPITIPAGAIHYNEKGLLELLILNPEEKVIGIDLIALGLARIP